MVLQLELTVIIVGERDNTLDVEDAGDKSPVTVGNESAASFTIPADKPNIAPILLKRQTDSLFRSDEMTNKHT